MNLNSSEYKEYLASREWAILREKVRKRSRNKCERCKVNKQDAVHHLTYERIGRELLEDLQAICKPCHEFLSAKSESDPLEEEVEPVEFEPTLISKDGILLCPQCGGNYTHAGKFCSRGQNEAIEFSCEGCDSNFAIIFQQHKGNTYMLTCPVKKAASDASL